MAPPGHDLRADAPRLSRGKTGVHFSRSISKRFQAKWMPVRVKKHVKTRIQSFGSDGPERTWAKEICASARLPAIYGELTHHVMCYTPVRAIFGCWFPLYPRCLPAIAATEHALFECSGIRKAWNVASLAIAKIERGL
jgi:hypothetical protein